MLLPPRMGAGCQDGWLSEKGRVGGRKFRWLQVQVAAWLARDDKSSDGRGRWTSVRDRFVNEEQQIWFGIARLDAQALRLPSRRIRHCGRRS
ncbi:hypothetical protein BHM03_00046968 [Ensete ventricosum]|nr:hypothetical protein BHM03_00046968 [Ensete ventricosum]